MKSFSFLDILSLAFRALLGLAVIWGLLTLFAFSLVIILPVLVTLGVIWFGYVWWKLHHLQTTTSSNTIEGEGREINVTETSESSVSYRHIQTTNTEE